MDNTNRKGKVWLITGCSTGFGRELAKHVIELGYTAAVTARNPENINDIVEGHNDNAATFKLDVTNKGNIDDVIYKVINKFRRIDVLVNNAGIGYFGNLEEGEDEKVRELFDVNFFGMVEMTKAVLPYMRKQRNGHILNMASIGGFVVFPYVGYYNATKAAIVSFSETLSKEVSALGIKVTVLAPSSFRTRPTILTDYNQSPNTIEDYAPITNIVRENITKLPGHEPGSPVLAARAIVKAVEDKNSPLHLLLGKAALKNAGNYLEELKRDFNAWQEVSAGADFPDSIEEKIDH